VLEIGCGLGGFGARFAARYDYTGVERDQTSYNTARPRIEPLGGRVVLGSVADLGIGDFDLVCAFEVLEHIEDDKGAAAEWAEMIAPRGAILLSVPAGPDRFGPFDIVAGHYRRYSPAQLREVLTGAGLRDLKLTHYGWPLGFLTEAVRHRMASRFHASGKQEATDARTSSSGRLLQPGRFVGAGLNVAVRPFNVMQKWRPTVGVGLVVEARKPA
jgi:SAM-dependent methyltransferase